jgi:hypothetical protein
VSEETIVAALRRGARPARSGADASDALPSSELDTGMVDMVPARTSLSGPGAQADPLGHALPVPQSSLHKDVPSTGGIVINEKFQDLFISTPVMSASASTEDVHAAGTPMLDTPTYADDASFYPEDEEGESYGVAV